MTARSFARSSGREDHGQGRRFADATRWCSRASGAGAHQFTRPSTRVKAGINDIRTSVASTSTASGTSTPKIRITDTSAATSEANVTAISDAAAVTTRPVPG